jgi:hypothetical protein
MSSVEPGQQSGGCLAMTCEKNRTVDARSPAHTRLVEKLVEKHLGVDVDNGWLGECSAAKARYYR